MPSLFTVTVSRMATPHTQQVPVRGNPVTGGGWGGRASEALSQCTGVPKKEPGQTSDCHFLR